MNLSDYRNIVQDKYKVGDTIKMIKTSDQGNVKKKKYKILGFYNTFVSVTSGLYTETLYYEDVWRDGVKG